MKDFFKRFGKHLFSGDGQAHVPAPSVFNLDAEIEAIRQIEAAGPVDRGKRIHGFIHQGLELRLDRDVLGWYRVTVNEGRERRYSFSIVCDPGDYEALRACYQEITAFLDSDRRPANLPRHERLKGHYYGH